MKKLKLFFASILALFSFAPVFAPAMVSAQATDSGNNLACGTDINLGGTNCAAGDASADTRVNNIIRIAIRLFQVIVGLISVVMIIVGGLKYITSGGDSGSVGSAKNTILYALVGIVVVALAEIIVQFVLNRVNSTGTSGTF